MIHMDMRNRMGRGHTAISFTSPNRQYYLHIAPSFESYLAQHLSYLRRSFYQIGSPCLRGNGRISTFFDVRKVHDSYLNNPEEIKEADSSPHDEMLKEFPFMSYTQKDGVEV